MLILKNVIGAGADEGEKLGGPVRIFNVQGPLEICARAQWPCART